MPLGPRARVALIAALALLSLSALVAYLSYNYRTRPVTPLPVPGSTMEDSPSPRANATPSPDAATPEPAATPSPYASPFIGGTPGPGANRDSGSAALSSTMRLMMPVKGVRPEQLRDTFTESRSEGRDHNAIDIVAPRGTPVLAAVDGRIAKLFRSDKGGITIYQLSTDERTVFYYAHLDRYADGLTEGRFARRGETIAFVGDTGNATPGDYHLHFQIYLITDPKSIWDGTPINPYPLLLGAER